MSDHRVGFDPDLGYMAGHARPAWSGRPL